MEAIFWVNFLLNLDEIYLEMLQVALVLYLLAKYIDVVDQSFYVCLDS